MDGLPRWEDFRNLRYSAGGYWLTREFSQRIGARLAYAGYRAGLSPSALTGMGLLFNIAASVVFATRRLDLATSALALLLYQIAYAFDCADGQLARGARQASAFGAWLDLSLDYLRCIAIGGAVLVVVARGLGSLDVALAAAGSLVAGMVISAHTGMALRRAPAAGDADTSPAWTVRALRVVIDTPSILIVLCAARSWPMALACYAAAMGIMDCAVASYVARRRLGAATA